GRAAVRGESPRLRLRAVLGAAARGALRAGALRGDAGRRRAPGGALRSWCRDRRTERGLPRDEVISLAGGPGVPRPDAPLPLWHTARSRRRARLRRVTADVDARAPVSRPCGRESLTHPGDPDAPVRTRTSRGRAAGLRQHASR